MNLKGDIKIYFTGNNCLINDINLFPTYFPLFLYFLPAIIYLFKFINRNIRKRCEICWKLKNEYSGTTSVTSIWCLYTDFTTFFVFFDSEHVNDCVLVFCRNCCMLLENILAFTCSKLNIRKIETLENWGKPIQS